MKNLINWFEIPVTDMARAIAFYEQVMQISLRRKPWMGRTAVFPYVEPGPGGALIKQDDVAPVAQGVVIYLHTADLLASIERVVLAGGKCVLEPMVPGDDIGTIALFIDSEGNRIGLHQPA